MALRDRGEKTLVFRRVTGCLCNGCLKKVHELLLKKHGTCSVDFNASEEKLTIQGSNVESNMVIIELGKKGKIVKLITEDNPTLGQASAMVVYKPKFRNQAVGLPALRIASHSYSKIDHEHKLKRKNYDKRFICNGCKEEGLGTRYRCKHCDYELHVDCMNPRLTVSHDLFKGSIFKFLNEKPTCSNFCRVHTKSCEACGNEIQGYSYHCEDKGVYLHPCCVNFGGNLCIQGEPYVLKTKATSKCFWCMKNKNGANSGWSYVSEGNNVQLHVNCMAMIAHEAWKERSAGGSHDVYSLVLDKKLNRELVENTQRNWWSRGGKLLKMIIVLARAIIGLLLGDPTVLLATMLVEVFRE